MLFVDYLCSKIIIQLKSTYKNWMCKSACLSKEIGCANLHEAPFHS